MVDPHAVSVEIGRGDVPESLRTRFTTNLQLPEGKFGPAWQLQDKVSGALAYLKYVMPLAETPGQCAASLRSTAEVIGHCQNAVPATEVIEGDTGVWLLRDWIEGENLGDALQVLTVLTHEQARILIGGVCRGLLGNEQEHVIHGNLGPSNILIDMNGRIAVSDHGLRAVGAKYGAAPDVYFTAPEVLAGSAPTVQSDVYALGALLYVALCGIYPLPLGSNEAGNKVILAAHNIVPPPRGVRLSGGVGNVVWRSFQLKPEDRFPSVESFLEALGQTRNGEPASFFDRLRPSLIGY